MPASSKNTAAPPPEAKDKSIAQRMLDVYAATLTAKMRKGQTLTPAEVRLIERAAAEASDRAWPDRDALCREMTTYLKRPVHARTVYEWTRHGAPIPRTGAIDKMPVWRWLAAEKREKGRPGAATDPERSDRLLDERIRKLVLANDAAAGSKISMDEAAAIIDTAAEDLKTALRHDLPQRAAEVAREAESLEAATIAIRGQVDTALAAFGATAAQLRARAEKARQQARTVA